MVALARTLDLAPASFQALVERLPPSQRAELLWFLPELRVTCVEPLRAIEDEDALLASIDDHLLRFARLNRKLNAAVLPLFRDAVLRDLVIAVDEERVAATHAKIERRVGAVDPYSADALRESYAWLREILPALFQGIGALNEATFQQLIAAADETDDSELLRVVTGKGRALLQLTAFTISAIEAVEDEGRELPPLITTWCELALDGVHAAVPVLRKAGLVIPAPTIPGATQREWRRRWADHVLEGMSDEQLEGLEQDVRRSSSTRAV